MSRFTSRWSKALLCSVAAIAALPAVASAGGRWDSDRDSKRRVDVRVDIDVSRDRFPRRDSDDSQWVSYEKRVFVEPVYRTVSDRVWVEPVYRDVCDRVWHEAVYDDRRERVWVDERFEYREVVRFDLCGNRIVCRERVCVEPGHYEERRVRVCVREGYWQDVSRREVVCDGHWKKIERRECVSEGYWTTNTVRERRNSWHGDGLEDRNRYARGDRGARYDD